MSLKDFFVEKDEEKEVKEALKKGKPTAAAPAPSIAPTNNFPSSLSLGGLSSGAPDADIVAQLNASATGSKLPAYDAFKVVYETLAGIPDGQRIDMALKVNANTNHFAAPDVLASLDDRIAIVENERKDFEASYAQSVESQVTSGKTEAENIDQRIAALREEIATLETKRVELIHASGDAAVELERSRSTFNASFDVVRSALKRERDLIATYATPTLK